MRSTSIKLMTNTADLKYAAFIHAKLQLCMRKQCQNMSGQLSAWSDIHQGFIQRGGTLGFPPPRIPKLNGYYDGNNNK